MRVGSRIVPCLWFDDQAEEAARFYTSVFQNSRIVTITPHGEAGKEIHGKTPGSVMTVEFELHGQAFTALNGGPMFTFNEAVSLQIYCEDQAELDHYWERLTEGGNPEAQQCGWLKDRFGVSWQVIPADWIAMVNHPDKAGVERVMTAMLGMKKLDMAALHRAFEGQS